MNLAEYQPKFPFTQRHLLTLQDWSEDDICQCLSLALRLKAMQKHGEAQTCLQGKTLAMIFSKSSTGSRSSEPETSTMCTIRRQRSIWRRKS